MSVHLQREGAQVGRATGDGIEAPQRVRRFCGSWVENGKGVMGFLAGDRDHGPRETLPDADLRRVGGIENPRLLRQQGGVDDTLNNFAGAGKCRHLSGIRQRPRDPSMDTLMAIVPIFAGRAVGVDPIPRLDAETFKLPRQARPINAPVGPVRVVGEAQKAIVDPYTQGAKLVSSHERFRRASGVLIMGGDDHRPRFLAVAEDGSPREDHLVIWMRDNNPAHHALRSYSTALPTSGSATAREAARPAPT